MTSQCSTEGPVAQMDVICTPEDQVDVVIQNELGLLGRSKVYIHIGGITIFRACKVENLTVSDERAQSLDPSTFLEDIEKVCRKHSLSISHEDTEGSFLIVAFEEVLLEWLKKARSE